VKYICEIDKNVVKFLAPNHEQFGNLSFNTVLSAILRLLDARVLDKKLHLIGIKILRKTIEVENIHTTSAAAEWEEGWESFRKTIKNKQKMIVQRGTIEFLCKHFSEETDEDIKEECILVCISVLFDGYLPA